MNFEIARGIGAGGLYGGTMLNIFEASIVAFERHGDRIYLVQRPHRFVAPNDPAAAKAVELTFGESVLASAKIESIRDDSAVVFDIYGWILSDLSGVGEVVNRAISRPGQQNRATFDRERSWLESVKAFPENVNIRAKLTFRPPQPAPLPSVPDGRYIPVSVHYSFAKLPEQPMKRAWPTTVSATSMTVHKDFSNDDGDDFFVRYVNRWRLEPKGAPGPDGLVEPVEPIVYYLDHNILERYRPYIKQGVEVWNRAFEAAGWKNAIRAEIPRGRRPRGPALCDDPLERLRPAGLRRDRAVDRGSAHG